MGVKVEVEGKDVVIKFLLKGKYLEVLDDRLEHHTSRRLTVSEKVQVTCEIFQSIVEDLLVADWSWTLADLGTEPIDIANDVIAESERGHV